VIDVSVAADGDQALDECLRRGLVVRSERQLAGRPGSRHYHLSLPGKPGTLELTESQGSVWFSVNERRDCGWVSDFAREVSAALGAAPDHSA
jgi:hypothetical protein